MRFRVWLLIIFILANLLPAQPSFAASRIKDIVPFEGVRGNKLVG